jgi:anaerobic ribonucleoside-triphosphate reductase activating protein
MLQARGLEALWHAVQAERPKWTLIVFSGYTGNQLREHGQAEQQKLLSSVDAFVGGPYVDVLNDGRGLRGSSNQEVWFPPQTRFTPAEQVSLREGSRRVELRMGERELLLIGVPRAGWRQPSQETKS